MPEGGSFIDPEGIYHVTKVANTSPRMLLESHFTWRLSDTIGIGPAMVVEPGDNLFTAAGGGLLIELGSGKTSFNIIIGGILDFSVLRVADGYVDGQLAPFGDDIILVDREKLSLLLATIIGF